MTRRGVVRISLLALCFLAFWPHAVRAAQPSLNMSLAEDRVDITTGFDGEKLSLFGVRREPGDVAVVVRGPETSITVRRKEQVLGVWMNRKSVTFENVPIYYDMAVSAPPSRLAGYEVLRQREIGLGNMEFRYTGREDDPTVDRFREALIRKRQQHGLFPLEPRRIRFMDGGFFRADFYLPPDVPTGVYTVYAYLFRDGRIVDSVESRLRVAQVGFNAELYSFAHRGPLLYGIASVFLALGMGWIVHAFLRKD